MGVEYVHYAIPRDNGFRPDADQLAELIKRLENGSWIIPSTTATPTCYLRTAEGTIQAPDAIDAGWLTQILQDDFILSWTVDANQAGGDSIRYPLLPAVAPEEEPYFDVKLEWSNEYVYRISEFIEPFRRTAVRVWRRTRVRH